MHVVHVKCRLSDVGSAVESKYVLQEIRNRTAYVRTYVPRIVCILHKQQ